jgi:hypothetical protein
MPAIGWLLVILLVLVIASRGRTTRRQGISGPRPRRPGDGGGGYPSVGDVGHAHHDPGHAVDPGHAGDCGGTVH